MADLSFADFSDAIRSMIADIGRGFRPDEDWMPTIFLLADDGLVVAGIDPEFMSSEPSKDQLADIVIPGLILQSKARMAAMVTTSWMVKVAPGTTYGRAQFDDHGLRLGPSLHPGRVEVATLLVCDAANSTFHTSEIARSPDAAPRLGAWEAPPGATAGGRFPEAMQRAFGQQPGDAAQGMRQYLREHPAS